MMKVVVVVVVTFRSGGFDITVVFGGFFIKRDDPLFQFFLDLFFLLPLLFRRRLTVSFPLQRLPYLFGFDDVISGDL